MRKRKKKPIKYRFRFKLDGKWVPSAWETNSIKEAQKMAKEYKDDTESQVWDYVNKCALNA